MPGRLQHVRYLARAVGWPATLRLLANRKLRNRRLVSAHSGDTRLDISPVGSDIFVAAQIFGSLDYEIDPVRRSGLNQLAKELTAAGRTPVIVDAGANVGYSPLYFAGAYPDAVVIAIEPDAETFQRLKNQCAGHDRIIPVNAALWKDANGVRLRNCGVNSWDRAVSEGGLTPSMTLGDVLQLVPDPAPLILKMDIEGAERAVVEAAPRVVRSFPCIMIEPHDFIEAGAGCLVPLYAALAGKEVDTLIRSENLILMNSNLESSLEEEDSVRSAGTSRPAIAVVHAIAFAAGIPLMDVAAALTLL